MISLLKKSNSLPAFSFLFLVAESDQGSSFFSIGWELFFLSSLLAYLFFSMDKVKRRKKTRRGLLQAFIFDSRFTIDGIHSKDSTPIVPLLVPASSSYKPSS